MAEHDDPDRWEPTIAAWEQQTRDDPPPRGAALFYGSSSITLWDDLPGYFPGIPCVQRGFGGSRTEHHLRYWRRVVLPCRPAAVVIYGGGNDISRGRAVPDIVRDYLAMVDGIAAASPGCTCLALSLKDKTNVNHDLALDHAFNDALAREAERRPHLRYLDVASTLNDPATGRGDPRFLRPDGVHITPEGYKRWAAIIRPVLDECLGR